MSGAGLRWYKYLRLEFLPHTKRSQFKVNYYKDGAMKANHSGNLWYQKVHYVHNMQSYKVWKRVVRTIATVLQWRTITTDSEVKSEDAMKQAVAFPFNISSPSKFLAKFEVLKAVLLTMQGFRVCYTMAFGIKISTFRTNWQPSRRRKPFTQNTQRTIAEDVNVQNLFLQATLVRSIKMCVRRFMH